MSLQEIMLYHYICVKVIKVVFDFDVKSLTWFDTFPDCSLEVLSSNVRGNGIHCQISAQLQI